MSLGSSISCWDSERSFFSLICFSCDSFSSSSLNTSCWLFLLLLNLEVSVGNIVCDLRDSEIWELELEPIFFILLVFSGDSSSLFSKTILKSRLVGFLFTFLKLCLLLVFLCYVAIFLSLIFSSSSLELYLLMESSVLKSSSFFEREVA